MKKRPLPLVIPTALASVVACLLGACEKSASSGSGEGGDPPAPPRPVDEMIELFPRKIARADRIAKTAQLPQTTEFRLGRAGEFSAIELEAKKLHPGQEWRSEQLSKQTTEGLNQLKDPLDKINFSKLVAPNFECSPLRPPDLEAVFRSGRVSVHRAGPRTTGDGTANKLTGPGGLRDALADLRSSFKSDEFEMRIKGTGITLSASREQTASRSFQTSALVELSGGLKQASGRLQIQSWWTCTWTVPAKDSDPPLLLGIQTDPHRYQETSLAANSKSPSTLFVDATAEVLGDTPQIESQFLHSVEHWATRLTRLGDFYLMGHQGLAVGDVNGDGLEDLYVCDGGSLPNRLFLQNPDGTVRDVSSDARVDFLEDSRSALLIDLDNDGDQDLVIATVAIIVFAENDGTGTFTVRGGHPGAPFPTSLTAADYDNDGDLDLYACVYEGDGNAPGSRGFDESTPVPFSDAENGGRNVLLENLGSFRFGDATQRSGLDMNNSRWSFAAAWDDYDQDGDADLYVANDFGRNCLYRNDAGPDGRPLFTEIAMAAGVEDVAAGMSVAWGDYNRDGRADLYVGNMFSSAGNLVHKGHSWSGNERNCCYLNEGNGRFANISHLSGLDSKDDGRAIAVTDWDQDGDLDLWYRNRTAPRLRLKLNRNNSDSGRDSSVSIRLRGTRANRDGVGAVVEVVLENESAQSPTHRRLVKSVRAGDLFLSQSSKWLHFGLGKERRIREIVVLWPGGTRESFADVAPGRRHLLKEGSGVAEAQAPRELSVVLPHSSHGNAPLPHPLEEPRSSVARILLPSAIPLPTLFWRDRAAQLQALQVGQGLRLLLIWSSSCPHCRAELSKLTSQAAALRAAGLDVLALSVDGFDEQGQVADPSPIYELMDQLRFPFDWGFIDQASLDRLQHVQTALFDRAAPASVPLSFLVDSQRNALAIYRGPQNVKHYLEDVRRCTGLDREERQHLAPPFAGRWFTEALHPGQIAEFMAHEFDQRHPEEALIYLQRAESMASTAEEKSRLALDLSRQHLHLARRCQSRDPPHKSAFHFESALKGAPKPAEILQEFGTMLGNSGMLDEAEAQFQKALAIDPDLSAALQGLELIKQIRAGKKGEER